MATEQPKPPTDELGYAGTTPPPWHTLQAGITDEITELLWPNSVKVYHTMRTDSQIDGLSKAVTLPIRRRRWGIDPNGARDEVVAKVASDMGLPILGTDENPGRGRRARFNHDEHLRHALLGLWYGGMFFEQVGEVDDELDWRLKKLAPRMPQSIVQIKVAPDGGLNSIVQYGVPGRTQTTRGPGSWVGSAIGTEIDVSRLVAYVWDREGANWAGRSMYRPLYRHWIIKDRLIRVDAMKNERFGLGIPYGRAPKGANEKTVTQYGALAQTMRAGAQAGVGLPSGAEVGVEGVKGTLPDIIASLHYHDEAMARSFLAMFIQLGQTETGARALGEEFIDFFELSVDAVCTWYATTTNEHVIEDIVDWNWGVDENAPVIGWEDDNEEEAPLAAADLVALIQNGVVQVDDNLRAWARDHWDLPESGGTVYPLPSPGTPAVPAAASLPRPRSGRTRRDVRASGTRAWTRVVHGQRERIVVRTPIAVAAKAAGSPGHVAARSQTLTRPNAAHRDMTPQEVAAATDFDAIQQTWADGTTDLVASWSDVKAQQVDELVAAVEAAAVAGNIEALATITAPILGAALIGDAMVRMAEDAINQARAEAKAQGVTIELVNVAEIEPLIRARAEATAALMARAISEAAARQGIQRYGVDSLAPADVAAGVRDHLESLSDVYLEDMLGGALTQAQNTGRRAVFGRGPTAKYYASELLDTNTCEACDAKDKTEYATLDEAQLDYPTGGYAECLGGARCRGTLVAVYEAEEEASVE